jgi:hypothetical protein
MTNGKLSYRRRGGTKSVGTIGLEEESFADYIPITESLTGDLSDLKTTPSVNV